MLKSISTVSEEIGISKAAIYKKLEKEKHKSLIVKENGKIMINEELFELLKSKRKKKVEVIKDVEIVKPKEVEIIQDNKNKNDKVLDVLLDQIKEKDMQIKRLYDLVEKNQRIIDRKEQKEEDQLKLEEHFKEIDRKLIEIRNGKKSKMRIKELFKKIIYRI